MAANKSQALKLLQRRINTTQPYGHVVITHGAKRAPLTPSELRARHITGQYNEAVSVFDRTRTTI